MSCDLHCHSKISDGSMGIDEIIAMAKRRGLSAIDITDHDAVAGATRAVVIGKRAGVEVVHGVEFSACDSQRQQKVHILGYMCDSPDRLEGLCLRINECRRQAAQEMIRKVLRYYPIVPESIVRVASGSTNIFRQHVMHALMDAGYADSIFGETYHKLFAPGTGCARVEMSYPEVHEVIDLIHSAGGLAVMAHPAIYHNEETMAELTAEGLLDGIEVWHPAHSDKDVAFLEEFATNNQLLMTGGSDFHGMYSRSVRPLAARSAPDGTVQLMQAYKNKKKR